jgi:hypothetical protein
MPAGVDLADEFKNRMIDLIRSNEISRRRRRVTAVTYYLGGSRVQSIGPICFACMSDLRTEPDMIEAFSRAQAHLYQYALADMFETYWPEPLEGRHGPIRPISGKYPNYSSRDKRS